MVAKDPDWTPPEPNSLLSLGAAEHYSGPGAGGAHTKIGAGHKPQPYEKYGHYASTEGAAENGNARQHTGQNLDGILLAESGRVRTDAGGGFGSSNEARRLEEKKFTPQKLVENARADIGSDRWHPDNPDGSKTFKCNAFVADKLRESNAPVPTVGGYAGVLGPEARDRLHTMTDGRLGRQAPSANDWFKGNVPGYEQVQGKPMPGDVATNGDHVGIVSGKGKTISVTTAEGAQYGHVVENDWGFRSGQSPVRLWRYKGSN